MHHLNHLWESDIAAFAHVSLFYIRYTFLIKKGRIFCKNTKIGWNTCQILSFSVSGNPKNTQLFSKSALDASGKWQICTCFDFSALSYKKAWNLLTILPPSFRDGAIMTICLQFFPESFDLELTFGYTSQLFKCFGRTNKKYFWLHSLLNFDKKKS